MIGVVSGAEKYLWVGAFSDALHASTTTSGAKTTVRNDMWTITKYAACRRTDP